MEFTCKTRCDIEWSNFLKKFLSEKVKKTKGDIFFGMRMLADLKWLLNFYFLHQTQNRNYLPNFINIRIHTCKICFAFGIRACCRRIFPSFRFSPAVFYRQLDFFRCYFLTHKISLLNYLSRNYLLSYFLPSNS